MIRIVAIRSRPALQDARAHDRRHRAAEAEHEGQEGLPVQAEGVQELVREEGRPCHVAEVLENGEAEKQDDDERYEGEDRPYPADDPVHDQETEDALGNHGLGRAGEPAEELLQPGLRPGSHREGDLEYSPEDQEEDRQPRIGVHEDPVNRIGDAATRSGIHADRLRDRAVDVAVALLGDDDLGVPAEMPLDPGDGLGGEGENPVAGRVRGEPLGRVRVLLEQLRRQPPHGAPRGDGGIGSDERLQARHPGLDLRTVVDAARLRAVAIGFQAGRGAISRGRYRIEERLGATTLGADRADEQEAEDLPESHIIDVEHLPFRPRPSC